MKRVRMVVAYDGTNYCGWQIQPNGITIEEVLNKALSDLLREPVVVIGASRTDSGVHAEGNVAVFDTENRMPAEKICFALNQRLPQDIRILKSEEVAPDWHPRKCNCTKTYEYKILNRKIDMPTLRLYSHFCYFPLDVEKMKEAAKYLVGEHDFRSFCTVRGQAEETVRTIYSLDVEKSGDMITIRISGSGFLYNMVRIIAGTLMKVGMGVYPPEHVEEILDARDRQAAGQTALPKGLTLISLDYETELKPEIVGENKYWKYRLIQGEVGPKGKAYLVIERCVEEEFAGLLTRVTHQAVRNGAREVYVCDREKEGRIEAGKNYGYYRFDYAHSFVKMGCQAEQLNAAAREDVSLREVEAGEAQSFCKMFNEVFFSVPNSATLTEEELKTRLAREEESVFWVMQQDRAAGFVMLIEKENGECEIDSLGIQKEFQKQGLAEAALAETAVFALEKKRERLTLLVADSNQPAYRLYQKCGFENEKLYSRWYATVPETVKKP